jgi:hypothetical protein
MVKRAKNARASRWDESAAELLAARRTGVQIQADLERLGPDSLTEFDGGTELGPRSRVGFLSRLAFGGDGATLFGIADEPRLAVVAWKLASGSFEELFELPAGRATAIASDSAGARLALFADREGDGTARSAWSSLYDIDVASRAATEVARASSAFSESVAHLGDILLSLDEGLGAKGRALRAFARPRKRKAGGRALVCVKIGAFPEASLSITGSLIVLRGRQVAFHEPLAKKPCAFVDLAKTAADFSHAQILAGDETAVVATSDGALMRVGRKGVTGFVRLPPWRSGSRLVASPSGRFVAVLHRARTRIDLVDLGRRESRSIALKARVAGQVFQGSVDLGVPAWSASGRQLAVPLESGNVLLVAALGAASRREAREPEADEETVKLVHRGNSKIRATLRRKGREIVFRVNGKKEWVIRARSAAEAPGRFARELKEYFLQGFLRAEK